MIDMDGLFYKRRVFYQYCLVLFGSIFILFTDINAQRYCGNELPFNIVRDTDSTIFNLRMIRSQVTVPLSLIAGGIYIHNTHRIRSSWQEDIRAWNPSFDTRADDFIQYVPVLGLIGAGLGKIESNNSHWDQVKYFMFSEIFTGVLIKSLKLIINERRPNGEYYSFPSGHTAQSFVGATVLYHEYKGKNSLLAYGGLVVASSVGYLRIMNNEHWASDVLVGAGIGVLVSNLVYHFKPLKNWNPWHNNQSHKKLSLLPYGSSNGIGIVIQYDL